MVQANNNQTTTEPDGPCCGPRLASALSPRLFKALADPTRLSLLVRMAELGEPATVSQVAEGSGVDMSVVSRHLATLREAGIVACERQGKEVHCRIQADEIALLLRELAGALEACCPEGRCDDRTQSEAGTTRGSSPTGARDPA